MFIKEIKISKTFISVTIILLSLITSLSFAVIGDGINILLVTFMGLSFLYSIINIDRRNLIFYLMLMGMLLSGILNFNTFRISSYGYSVLFILYLVTLTSLLRRNIYKITDYIKLLKFIIIIYCVFLVIQQLMHLIGFETVFNQINSDPSLGKYNSLATEPSYAARFLTIVLISYVKMREFDLKKTYSLKELKSDYIIWLLYLYQIVTMNSAFGYLLIMLFLLKFVNWRTIIVVSLSIIAFVFLAVKFEINAFLRVYNVLQAVITFSDVIILKADHSAAMRIVPTMMYFKSVSLSSLNCWFGYGADYAKNFVPTVVPGIMEGRFLGGFLPVYLFDYGLINAFLTIIMIRRVVIVKVISVDTLILILCIGAAPFNSQLFWGILSLYSVNKFFLNKV